MLSKKLWVSALAVSAVSSLQASFLPSVRQSLRQAAPRISRWWYGPAAVAPSMPVPTINDVNPDVIANYLLAQKLGSPVVQSSFVPGSLAERQNTISARAAELGQDLQADIDAAKADITQAWQEARQTGIVQNPYDLGSKLGYLREKADVLDNQQAIEQIAELNDLRRGLLNSWYAQKAFGGIKRPVGSISQNLGTIANIRAQEGNKLQADIDAAKADITQAWQDARQTGIVQNPYDPGSKLDYLREKADSLDDQQAIEQAAELNDLRRGLLNSWYAQKAFGGIKRPVGSISQNLGTIANIRAQEGSKLQADIDAAKADITQAWQDARQTGIVQNPYDLGSKLDYLREKADALGNAQAISQIQELQQARGKLLDTWYTQQGFKN